MPAPLQLMPPPSPAPEQATGDHWDISTIVPDKADPRAHSKGLMRVSIEHIGPSGNTHFGAACYVPFDRSNDEHDAAARAAIEDLIKKHDAYIDDLIEQDREAEISGAETAY